MYKSFYVLLLVFFILLSEWYAALRNTVLNSMDAIKMHTRGFDMNRDEA